VEEARTLDFFLAPRHPYSRGLLASVPRLAKSGGGDARGFRAIPGTVPDLSSRAGGMCAFAPRCPDRFEPCDRREPDLYAAGESVARCFLYDPAKGRSA